MSNGKLYILIVSKICLPINAKDLSNSLANGLSKIV